MFSILKNPEASSEELAEAYANALKFEEKLEAEKVEAKNEMLSLQIGCLEGKPTKEFLKAKNKLDGISGKLEAVQFGREQLKTRIGERLRVEAQERLEEIEQELSEISGEKRQINQEFLNFAAKAAVLREKLKGITLTHDCKGNYQPCVPSLEVRISLMDQNDGEFYSKCVEHYRREIGVGDFSQTLRGRESILSDERERLEKLLQSGPEGAAQDLLDKLCPPRQEPEPQAPPDEPESRKTSEFTIDYDKIGGPDYEEGPALPYRGVGEILAERAKS